MKKHLWIWTFLLLLSCVPAPPKPPDTKACMKLQLLEHTAEASSSAISVLFAVKDCEGKVVPNLPNDSFVIQEDNAKLSVEAAQTTLNRRGLVAYITLLLDMSSSTQPNLTSLIVGAEAFVNDLLVDKKLNVKIGIELFSGEAKVTSWVRWTSDSQLLLAKLKVLRGYVSTDPSSTNINGALIESSQSLSTWTKGAKERSFGGLIGTGYLVLFTDGKDTSGRKTDAETQGVLNKSNLSVLVVGLKSPDYEEDQLKKYATDGVSTANNATELKDAFSNIATLVSSRLSATYLVGFCSTKRAGEHTVTLQAKEADNPESQLSFTFNADGFGPGCNAAYFEENCKNRECGGLACGQCDEETSFCEKDTLQCKNFCTLESSCGLSSITNAHGYTQSCTVPAGIMQCGSQCVDTTKDTNHCGQCDLKCPVGISCENGSCACGGGQTVCADSCVDTQSNIAHCGTCGVQCPSGIPCTNGKCACPAGQSVCNGVCVDTSNNRSHCGGCNTKCPTGIPCDGGKCECAAGKSICADSCVDTQSDLAHCGGCNNNCSDGRTCQSGTCLCPNSGTYCGNGCFDAMSDTNHCGGCNTKCPTGIPCTNGVCACPSGQITCGGACVDTSSNTSHCGSCNTQCPSGIPCDGGKCECAATKSICSGVCVDTQTNGSHCGGCNTKCSNGTTCDKGNCKCPGSQVVCNNGCVDTQTDGSHCGGCNNACPSGIPCRSGKCQCPPNQVICGGACVDTQSNGSHCGGCNTVCPLRALCQSGSCQCPTSQVTCNNECFNTTTDSNHCGGCNNKCTDGRTCQSGSCLCPNSGTYCSNGCFDTTSDSNHCGGCNNKCLNGNTCQGGTCKCPTGYTDCSSQCVDLQSDSSHCSACAKACPASEVCIAGLCKIPSFAVRAGGTSDDRGHAIARDAKGNLYVTGYFVSTVSFGTTSLTSAGGQDVFVAKLDSSGNFLWVKRVGGAQTDSGYAIAVDGSGNSYVTGEFVGTVSFGTTSLTSAGGLDVFVAKLDSSGNFLWAKRAGGSSTESGRAIAVDGNGNVYVTGFFYSVSTFGTISLTPSGSNDIFVTKLDSSGNFQWAKRAGGSYGDYGYGIAVDSSGNSYVTGAFYGTATFGMISVASSGNTEVFVAKLDSSGNFLWAKRAAGVTNNDSGFGRAIALDGSGNAYITGNFSIKVTFGMTSIASAGSNDIFVAKLDSSGNFLWAKSAGGLSIENGYGIAVDGNGNSYITGYFSTVATFGTTTLTSAGGLDVFVAKLDSSGNFQWAKRAGANNVDYGYGIAVDSSGNSYVTGFFNGTATFGTTSLASKGSGDIFVWSPGP